MAGKENAKGAKGGKRKAPNDALQAHINGQQQPAASEPPAAAPHKKAKATDATNGTASPAEVHANGRSGRQTNRVDYKEQTGGRTGGDARLVIKDEATVANEGEALEQTGGAASTRCKRRLVDFDIVDGQDTRQPLEGLDLSAHPLSLTGVVHPASGKINKESGRRVLKIGPVTGWSIDFAASSPQVVVSTKRADYAVSKPASAYKAIAEHLLEAAGIALHCYRAVAPSAGGTAEASLAEVVAKLVRAKAGKSYSSPRESLLLNAKFVAAQLCAKDQQLAETPFIKSLIQEARQHAKLQLADGSGMKICEPTANGGGSGAAAAADGAAAEQMELDEDFARQLQAKMNAEEARRGQPGGPRRSTSGKAYIKVHESEIADDYPEPAQYVGDGEEIDELLLFGEDEDMGFVDPEHLPRRLLKNFSIYNAEGFMASLELLPMWSGVDPDVDLFASGTVLDDDGEWSGGQTLDATADAADAGGSSSANGSAAQESGAGMQVFLSQIREWVVDFSADLLFISLRTDVAWYRLSTPAEKYRGWFNTVLKGARLAVQILQMLSEEARASRLSFNDIVRRLAQQPEDSPTFISKKVPAVERFVVVHAQIILNQFAHFPNKAVKSSAFANSLRAALETRRHHKLYASAARVARRSGINRNPMRNSSGPNRQKPMAATATAMVKAIWQSYFAVGGALAPDDAAEAAAAEAAPTAKEVEEDENEEEEEGEAAEVENALAASCPKKSANKAKSNAAAVKLAWMGSATNSANGTKMYRKANVGGIEIGTGDVVALTADENEATSSGAPLGLVQAMWETSSGGKKVQLRGMLRGADTVLGDAASDIELFLTDTLLTRPLQEVTDKVTAERWQQLWGHDQRRAQCAADAARRERNAAAVAAGNAAAVEHVFSKLYLPHGGMFADAPADLQLGTRLPEPEEEEEGIVVSDSGNTFKIDGVQYAAGDYVFLLPDVFDQMPEATVDDREAVPDFAANSRHVKGGANAGLRAYAIARIVRLGASDAAKGKKGGKKGAASSDKLTVQRFYRPEDISRELAYTASFTDVYESSEEATVSLDNVVSKCSVLPPGSSFQDPTVVNSFVLAGTFSRKSKKVSPPKENSKGKASSAAAAAPSARHPAHGEDDGVALATLDIFAGCGGLSEGLSQAGAAISKWAIEYEAPAAEAFRLNHPKAATFCANCNVILARAMANAGAADDCDASEEAKEQAAAMEEEVAGKLPLPGQVAMIVGGPPCQGYSGMNRFNKGNWSMVQNSMVMAYLSFADFYRPRYFLLENVRNFVSHNKSFTFRLTLRSLLDMGYQVRFGVLNAGNFGVAQSRKRTIILAAAPGETLPEWPAPAHVFSSPQLTINLPGGVAYTAVPPAPAAPRRAVTVRDAIGDLPPIENGADVEEMPYSGPPQSDFQRAMREGAEVLVDHVSKEMNDINLERCRCIPTNTPGADWRCLEAIVKADPSREKYKGQPLVPWCLPNTAERHNGWRGLFGRLDWRGHFPTSTTDPQPMGKVGQVFHPDQHRIISVRECARAQGFPDTFRFAGNVHAKHRQIGNAVPPPLAAALGRQLRKVLDGKAHTDVQKSMEAALAAL